MEHTFDHGTILVRGDIRVPNYTWDERSNSFRAMALYYMDIIDFLKTSGFDFRDDVLDLVPCPELQTNVVLRDYQKQALDALIANGKRGIVVLPTGSGKTIIGIKANSQALGMLGDKVKWSGLDPENAEIAKICAEKRKAKFMRMIEIEVIGKGKALAKLDERNPRIREAFFMALPLEGTANLWGEEVYFDVPLQMENENPSPYASAGDICYWSPGPAFCIFFGKTQPYSAVNHIGKVTDGLEIFNSAATGDRIVLNRR